MSTVKTMDNSVVIAPHREYHKVKGTDVLDRRLPAWVELRGLTPNQQNCGQKALVEYLKNNPSTLYGLWLHTCLRLCGRPVQEWQMPASGLVGASGWGKARVPGVGHMGTPLCHWCSFL